MGPRRRRRRIVLAAVVLAGLAAVAVVIGAWDRLTLREPAADGPFLVKPYVQWGSSIRTGSTGGLDVLWQGADRDERWALEVRPNHADSNPRDPWAAAGPLTSRRVAVGQVAPRRLYRGAILGQTPGCSLRYRVVCDGVPAFEADVRIPETAARPHRFVVFGDGGADTWGQREVAYQAFQARPDLVMITGDLVYYKGSLAEYLHHFFPIYNSNAASPRLGAPLLRSTPVLAAPGNHDLIERDLDRCPDGLAYFLLWSLPLNGPIGTPGAAGTPVLRGTPAHQRALLDAAGPAYPRMANYSFDHAGAHWAVLDTNAYADWTDPALRDWLARDLGSEAARDATWRFVAFHQPPFHSGRAHAEEQRSRVLADLLERFGVDIVFCGHIHNYQRTYPLRFAATGSTPAPDGRVPGRWTLDRSYDGVARTRPDGIIYVTSGAGGARLYDRGQDDDPASWQEFTARFVANTHSLTVVDVADDRLTLRQVSAEGAELDRFVVTRGEPEPVPEPALSSP